MAGIFSKAGVMNPCICAWYSDFPLFLFFSRVPRACSLRESVFLTDWVTASRSLLKSACASFWSDAFKAMTVRVGPMTTWRWSAFWNGLSTKSSFHYFYQIAFQMDLITWHMVLLLIGGLQMSHVCLLNNRILLIPSLHDLLCIYTLIVVQGACVNVLNEHQQQQI